MCTSVIVRKNGNEVYVETVGGLARALGVSAEDVSEDGDNFCLCNAYLNKLGARLAMEDEGYPFPEYIIDCT